MQRPKERHPDPVISVPASVSPTSVMSFSSGIPSHQLVDSRESTEETRSPIPHHPAGSRHLTEKSTEAEWSAAAHLFAGRSQQVESGQTETSMEAEGSATAHQLVRGSHRVESGYLTKDKQTGN